MAELFATLICGKHKGTEPGVDTAWRSLGKLMDYWAGTGHRRTVATFLAFVALACSPALAADQFDLKCQGEQQFGIKDPAKPHSYGFRIDLKARKWCWSHCDIIYDIQEVQPDRLVLKREDRKTEINSRYFYNEINRINGQHDLESIITRPVTAYYRIKGQCEPAPFSGFPATKF